MCFANTKHTHLISTRLGSNGHNKHTDFFSKDREKKLIYKKTIQVVFVTQTHISYPHVVLYFFVFQQK